MRNRGTRSVADGRITGAQMGSSRRLAQSMKRVSGVDATDCDVTARTVGDFGRVDSLRALGDGRLMLSRERRSTRTPAHITDCAPPPSFRRPLEISRRIAVNERRHVTSPFPDSEFRMMICGGDSSSSVRGSSLVWRTDRLSLRAAAKQRSQHRPPGTGAPRRS